MRPALIHINSYPGVGKLTIGRHLATALGAKLLDNHTIYNVAFALTEFKSDAFYTAVKDVRDIAYNLVKSVPDDVPVILTNAHAQTSTWGNACWDEAIALAQATGRAHLVVLLDCSRDENARRIQSAGRMQKRKPTDPKLFRQGPNDLALIERGADQLVRLDVTSLSPEEATRIILDKIAPQARASEEVAS